MARRISIATAADDGYGMAAAAMLRSVAHHLPAGWSADVFFIDGGLTETTRGRLEESCGDDLDIYWRRAKPLDSSKVPMWGRLPDLTYQRLMLPELTPRGVERVLYLDVDLVVNRNLVELWDESLDGRVLAAVQDLAVPYVSSPLGLRKHRELGIPASRTSLFYFLLFL